MENKIENIKTSTDKEIRKSKKYEGFPEASIGQWGPEVREKRPDQLTRAILARIKHISGRINSYIDTSYKVDKTIALELENSFSELADMYLEYNKEGTGGYFYPESDNHTYPYDTIKKFDEKLEEIHDLVIKAEGPFFDERGDRIFDKGEELYRKASEQEKTVLHKEGEDMIKKSIEEIKDLIKILKNRKPLV